MERQLDPYGYNPDGMGNQYFKPGNGSVNANALLCLGVSLALAIF